MAPIVPVSLRSASPPRIWNVHDSKRALLDVSDHGLKIAYKGLGNSDTDAGAIRADNPAPESEPLYYFEVTIISRGRNGYIGVGLSSPQASLSRLPGLERNSFGYHADDGNAFTGCCTSTLSHEGTAYGPTFGKGDVIGCILNQMDHTISYTKNGVNLGVAFRDVKGLSLYPTVGLRTPGEKVEANFGSKPFIFDLENLQKALEMKTLWTIDGIGTPDKNSRLHSLVDSYLMHYGYSDTASALIRESALEGKVISVKEAESMHLRRKIQEAVLDGRIDEAIEQTNYIAPEEVISLLAYPHPEISPLRHLIQPSRREAVADSLNQAILVAQGKPALPALEMLHKQLAVTKEVLSQRSPGSASMIDAYEEFHGLSYILDR
uniref:B30.2/SPRY domain-containing protein n=1 Tax=Physcomitrium patens TaxID=3218 RepID=A0A7I4BK45_PHYPA